MTQDERRLLRLFRALPPTQRAGLLDYAEFLAARAAPEAESRASQAPLDIPRPAEENVVKAIKRLRSTYPMLDSKDLLHETSSLMAQHVVHKRPSGEVIDDLEALFRRHYDRHAGDKPA
jgi:hypothetical protein